MLWPVVAACNSSLQQQPTGVRVRARNRKLGQLPAALAVTLELDTLPAALAVTWEFDAVNRRGSTAGHLERRGSTAGHLERRGNTPGHLERCRAQLSVFAVCRGVCVPCRAPAPLGSKPEVLEELNKEQLNQRDRRSCW
eukprot:366076-Chlamydomonas_euryale.AAC.2